jgi:phosphatidylethanolamine N-methyltransferase
VGQNAIWRRYASLFRFDAALLTRVTATINAVFRVPTTHDVITALFHPSYPKSHIDILNLGLLALQLVLFYALPRTPRKLFFFLYFAFWRAAYDAGLGYVLTKQSKRKWISKTVQRLGWLDQNRRPEVRAWIRKQLVGKMGKDYSFDVRPFIHVVDSTPPIDFALGTSFGIQHLATLSPSCRHYLDQVCSHLGHLSTLLTLRHSSDFLSFCLFAFACFRVPSGLSTFVHVLR